jgi:hypothetical protein
MTAVAPRNRVTRTRRRRNVEPLPIIQITTVEMRALAGRLATGTAASADLHLAGQLVLALTHMLLPDSNLQFLGGKP